MTSPRGILKKYRIRPSKSLGQSFLIDNNVTAKIVASADITGDDIVVEIGAGIGVMTGMMAGRVRKVIALEIDPTLVEVLRAELGDFPNVEIINQDVMKYDFASAAKEGRRCERKQPGITVIGNIPYNISTQIFFRLIDFKEHIGTMVLMFQREVGERMTAHPGTKDYGILSVMTKMYTLPSRVMPVPASCFYPKPKVDSVVLKMIVREKPRIDIKDENLFLQVVKAGFSMRRKTLFNNLKRSALLSEFDRDIHEIFHSAGIDGQRRGETLTVEEFGRLSNTIYSVQNS